MALFYLTNMSLDILWGVTWWIIKKTRNGVNYIAFPNNSKTTAHNRILRLEDRNKKQEQEIVELKGKINIINTYLLNKT